MIVAVQAGTKYEEYLKALKAKIGFTLQSYPGDTDAVAQVLHRPRRRRADAGHVVRVPGEAASGQDRDRRTRSPAKDAFGIYYRKGDARRSARRSSDGVAKLKSNGTLAKIATKYKIPVADVK